jgi:hypothetical protein
MGNRDTIQPHAFQYLYCFCTLVGLKVHHCQVVIGLFVFWIKLCSPLHFGRIPFNSPGKIPGRTLHLIHFKQTPGIEVSVHKNPAGFSHRRISSSPLLIRFDGFTVSPMYVRFQRCHFFIVSDLYFFER